MTRHRGQRYPLQRKLPALAGKERTRYFRLRSAGCVCLFLAGLAFLGFVGVWTGGGWLPATWFALVVTLALAVLAVAYFIRSGSVVLEAVQEAARAKQERPASVYLRRYQAPGGGAHASDVGGSTRRIRIDPGPEAARAQVPTQPDDEA